MDCDTKVNILARVFLIAVCDISRSYLILNAKVIKLMPSSISSELMFTIMAGLDTIPYKLVSTQ